MGAASASPACETQRKMNQYFKSLDGLRAVAVGIVMIAHAGLPYPRSGGVGVDIFFVLSGFLITGILAKEFRDYGSISRKNFYVRRFLRLTPCLLACLLLFVGLSAFLAGHVRWDVVGICLTYTGDYARALFDYDLQSMGHGWSLAIEEQYYLVWPLAIILLERASGNNVTKFLILLATALAFSTYRAVMVGTFSAARIYYALDTHVDGLIFGSALAYFRPYLIGENPLPPFAYKLLSWVAVPLLTGATLYLMRKITWWDPWMGRYGFTFVAIAAGILIIDLTTSPVSLARPVLENRVLVYIGKISYGLYLYHLPIYDFLGNELSDQPRVVKVTIVMLVSLAVAAASYHFYEKKFLGLKRHFGHARKLPA